MALLKSMLVALKGAQLRQVRWTMLRVAPSLGALWQWLRAAATGS